MKSLFILVFCLFSSLVYGEESSLKAPVVSSFASLVKKAKPVSEAPESVSEKDGYESKSSKSMDKKAEVESESSKSVDKTAEVESESSKSMDKTAEVESESSKSMDKNQRPVTQKIKQVFLDFIEILETEALDSEEYKKAVKFLEDSLYNSASFETLRLLATVYKDKGDSINYIKVLNVLSKNHPNNPESFYLLGMVYKELYFKEKEKHPRNKQEKKERKDKMDKYKPQSVDYFNQALKINSRYVLAYRDLLGIFMVKNPKTDELIHNKESLEVVMDMLRSLRKNKYYILLCQAYYDNNFFKQSRKACAKSVKKNPDSPRSHILLALSQPVSKENHKNVLKAAQKFKKSFFVQYKAAYFFMDKDPQVAITHFERAYILQPEHVKLNEIMAQFLFDNNEEEQSQRYFLNVCLLTKGKNLKRFRAMAMQLYGKEKKELVPAFQEGINKCFRVIREKLQTKPKSSG